MMMDGPQTETTMCDTTAQKSRFMSDFKDVEPMMRKPFFDEESEEEGYASPTPTKRTFTEDLFQRAPQKNFDNREAFDIEPMEFNMDGILFPEEQTT